VIFLANLAMKKVSSIADVSPADYHNFFVLKILCITGSTVGNTISAILFSPGRPRGLGREPVAITNF